VNGLNQCEFSVDLKAVGLTSEHATVAKAKCAPSKPYHSFFFFFFRTVHSLRCRRRRRELTTDRGLTRGKPNRKPYRSFDGKKMEWQLTNAFGCREEFDYTFMHVVAQDRPVDITNCADSRRQKKLAN
jgi:hypothetical protein